MLPPGWRGWVLETFGGRAFETGVQDGVQRLKRAAEAHYRGSLVEQS